jgi:tetratricopeptide (TPR) repeat protein
LRQEVAELIKAVTDLVPKRDFIALTYTLEELQRQHADLQDAIANLNEALHSATQDSHAVSDQQQAQIDWVTTLQEDIYQLQTQLDELTRYVQRGAEHSIVQTVMQQVVAQLPTTLDVAALQQQFQVLAARVEEAEIELLNTKQQFHGAETLGQHQLVFDLPGSASTPSASSSQLLLDTAIQQAQHHLTLVWPWSDQMALDARLLNQIEALLQRHVRVDFGWCHQGDRREGRFITPIQQRWSTYPHHHQDLQAVLQQLVPLKQRYPHHFKFKVLGTDENFLVCDRDFAVVGLQTLLTQTTVFPVLGLKLRTKDETVIQRLIQRFQQSHIDPEDRVAFFNRAITRHDLSDYAGALADYTQVLHLHRQDDVAYNNRGLVHYDMGKVQSALQDISQAIHLQPDSFIPRCNRAVLYLEQQHFAAAIADLDVALMKNNQSSIAWFYRGISHQKQGDWLLALSDFSQSLEQDSTAAFVYCYRSAVYRKLNQISNAIADLEQAAQRLLEQEDVPNYQRVCCALSKLKGSDAPAYLEATPPRPLSSQWRSSRNESEAQSRRVL